MCKTVCNVLHRQIKDVHKRQGLKCTKQRISVMQVLSDADAPLTVENIYDKVDGMSLSTVYRIAEKLCEKGIVSKHTIQDSDKFYYELDVYKRQVLRVSAKKRL